MSCASQFNLCQVLKPPPLPADPTIFQELRTFIYSNATLKSSYVAYYNCCNDGVIPIAPPDIRPSTTNGSTANAGLIIALVITIAILLVVGFFIYWRYRKWRWEKKQSSKALPMEQYSKTNYLHNKAVIKKPYSSSSAEEGKISPQKTGTLPTMKPEVVKYDTASHNKVSKLKLKTDKGQSEQGAINASYVTDEKDRNEPESPGITSVKSDTPLIDSVDGMVLPGQTMTGHVKSHSASEKGEKKTRNGTTHQIVPPSNKLPAIETKANKLPAIETKTNNLPAVGTKMNGLPPVETTANNLPEKKPKKPSKKKRRSILDARKSEPCQNAADLVEDLADNRKSV